MSKPDLVGTLTREHHDVDAAIESFIEELDGGEANIEPMLAALELLRRHIYLEEAFLFPPIRQAGMMMPILVMLREHAELWSHMDALIEALEAGDTRHEALRRAGQELLVLLEQHNSKEEPIVYPRAEVDLTEEASQELARFLDEGTMPTGWVSGDPTP